MSKITTLIKQNLVLAPNYNFFLIALLISSIGTRRHSLKHMKEGSCIINTASVTAYAGSPHQLLDYLSTKGSIVSFTRGLALRLVDKGIRVNGVAPGPIWTPLQPASLPAYEVEYLGSDVPMRRAGQPYEMAPSYVFLASNQCSSYMTGQVLHPNGMVEQFNSLLTIF